MDRNHSRPQGRKREASQVARPGHDCACPPQRLHLRSATAAQPPGRLRPGCNLEPAQLAKLAMRLLPIFFLGFSSSVLWAQSPPVWTPAVTPPPAATPRSGAAADPTTPENKVVGNAADQQDAQPAVSPVAAIP